MTNPGNYKYNAISAVHLSTIVHYFISWPLTVRPSSKFHFTNMADKTENAPDGATQCTDSSVMDELLAIRAHVGGLRSTLQRMQEDTMARDKDILAHMQCHNVVSELIVDFFRKKKDKAKRKAKRTNKDARGTAMTVSDMSASSSAAPLATDDAVDGSCPSAKERRQMAFAMGAYMSGMFNDAIATGTPGDNETEDDVRARFGEHVHWVTPEERGQYKFGANCGTPAKVKAIVQKLLDAGLDPTVICKNVDGNIYYTPKDFEGYTAKYGW